ncbi:fructoselysine 6-kinase [Paenibacillus albidus]|uniref:fructoselysine 6-kinase n=1 Tax=Paenibacillus albidus TaxID=2041023 RepID=UPI001BEC63A7|nr:fructoselysine 6-kinase [Paenibacillus albidus]MBT2293648.1 fructoselysine 6-kinase [Paenibacillus albidus]
MRVAGVGFNCIDIYENLQKSYPTGNSVDFIIHMSRFGMETSMISVVGSDKHGEWLREVLRKEKVDISHLHVEEGDTAIFKMDLNGKDRVHKEKVAGVMESFALTDEDIAFALEHEVIHTNLSGNSIELLPLFRSKGIRVVFDFTTKVNSIPEFILPHVDYAFFSYDQDDIPILEYMKWAQALGPDIVVVTLGEKGSIAYDGQSFFREGICKVPVVNTVGAGDSFCAGFMYSILRGSSIPDALRKGAETAAMVVAKFEPY